MITRSGHQQVKTPAVNRLHGARGRRDTTRIGRRRAVHCHVIQDCNFSAGLDTGAIFNHGCYLTERMVSAFGETHEGHTSPMYRLTGSPHGALHRGFRRFAEELRGTGRQVVGGDDGG